MNTPLHLVFLLFAKKQNFTPVRIETVCRGIYSEAKMTGFVFERVENKVGKGENYFNKLSISASRKRNFYRIYCSCC